MANKLVSVIVSILTVNFIVIAQTTLIDKYDWEKKDDGNYGCMFDRDGGHIDLFEKGQIIQIVDGNAIIFKSEKGLKRKVNLITVEPASNEKTAKVFLEENALNKDAGLIYSSSQIRSKNVNGIIEIDGKEINRSMLELGIVKYKESKAYQISSFNDCVYLRSKDKAKAEKLGVWAK